LENFGLEEALRWRSLQRRSMSARRNLGEQKISAFSP
jgi:hypothetical protein